MRKLRTSHELPSWPPRGHQGEIAAAWAVPNGSMHLGGAPNLKAKLTRGCGRTFLWVGVSAKIRMGMPFFTAEEFSKFRQNKSQQRGIPKKSIHQAKRRSLRKCQHLQKTSPILAEVAGCLAQNKGLASNGRQAKVCNGSK